MSSENQLLPTALRYLSNKHSTLFVPNIYILTSFIEEVQNFYYSFRVNIFRQKKKTSVENFLKDLLPTFHISL